LTFHLLLLFLGLLFLLRFQPLLFAAYSVAIISLYTFSPPSLRRGFPFFVWFTTVRSLLSPLALLLHLPPLTR
jgi:hypothetical protein